MSTDELSGEHSAGDASWTDSVTRRRFLKAGGLAAGGLALSSVAGTGSAAARSLASAAKAGPLSKYTMAVSEPIVVEAISSFVVAQQAAAKHPALARR